MRIFILIIVGLAFSSSSLFSQQDSLRVFITGVGGGEKYKIIYEGKELFRFKTDKNAGFKEYFDIPFKSEWKKSDRIYSLYILRKSGLGLFWKELDVVAYFESKRFLILRREFKFRDSIAFDYEWTDVEPDKPPGFGH